MILSKSKNAYALLITTALFSTLKVSFFCSLVEENNLEFLNNFFVL